MKSRVVGILLLLGSLAAFAMWRAKPVSGRGSVTHPDGSDRTWNEQAAARYLDDRELWWQAWPRAQKDHGTICISCHTVVPYAMSRPGLRRELGETAKTAPEQTMLASVEKRVSQWSEMVPFYSDAKYGQGKAAESRATEAVLNAIILGAVDAHEAHVRPITRTAFDNAWVLQEDSGDNAGGWKWQNFDLGPWESSESAYQGAALLLVGATNLPGGFAREPGTRKHLDRVRDYLRRNYSTQPVLNQLYVLWASAKEPGLLTGAERKTLLAAVRGQQQADGGWRTMAIDKRDRIDHSPEPMESDGYATGLVVLALEESGTAGKDSTLKRGLDWLAQHQSQEGTWNATSINKLRDPASDPSHFMKDAATAYAALALEKAR